MNVGWIRKIKMDLTQIKAIYLAQLNEKLAHCFSHIERDMIDNFQQIEEKNSFTIGEKRVNEYFNDFDTNYKNDIIKEIQKRYSENWDVSYVPENKKNENHFIFTYKGQPANSVSNIEHHDTIMINKEEEPTVDRFYILDLDNG